MTFVLDRFVAFSFCAWESARESVERNGTDLPFTFIGLDREEQHHFIVAHEYHQKREFYQMLLRAYTLKHGIELYSVAFSAWMLRFTSRKDFTPEQIAELKKKLPSQDPNRIEVLSFFARSPEGLIIRTGEQVHARGKISILEIDESTQNKIIPSGSRDFEEMLSGCSLYDLTNHAGIDPTKRDVLDIVTDTTVLSRVFSHHAIIRTAPGDN
jgi:hypothetical protein